MYARTHKSTHSLTKPPTNRHVTITPPTLLRGDKNVLKLKVILRKIQSLLSNMSNWYVTDSFKTYTPQLQINTE